MKIALPSVLTASLIALALVVTGCGGPAKTKMDTKEFAAAFATADAALKTPADAAVKSLNAGQLLDGATSLVAVAKAGADKLSEPQKNALINLGATIQLVMSEDGDKADLKIYQAVEDLMAVLNERDASKVGTTPDRVVPPKATGR